MKCKEETEVNANGLNKGSDAAVRPHSRVPNGFVPKPALASGFDNKRGS